MVHVCLAVLLLASCSSADGHDAQLEEEAGSESSSPTESSASSLQTQQVLPRQASLAEYNNAIRTIVACLQREGFRVATLTNSNGMVEYVVELGDDPDDPRRGECESSVDPNALAYTPPSPGPVEVESCLQSLGLSPDTVEELMSSVAADSRVDLLVATGQLTAQEGFCFGLSEPTDTRNLFSG